MNNYKVKNDTGPWKAGDIITDADLKAHPQFGGVARLREKLGSIEDTTDEPGQPGDAENTTGNTKPGASTAADIGPGGAVPNAKASPRAGKS